MRQLNGPFMVLAYMQDISLVRSLLQQHVRYTNSSLARSLLANWETTRTDFVKVFPHEFRAALAEAEQQVSPPNCTC